MTQELELPTSAGPRPSASAYFGAYLERSVFMDRYSTAEQRQMADQLDAPAKRAFATLIDFACGVQSKWSASPPSRGEPGDGRAEAILAYAPWIEPRELSRLLGAAAFMMR